MRSAYPRPPRAQARPTCTHVRRGKHSPLSWHGGGSLASTEFARARGAIRKGGRPEEPVQPWFRPTFRAVARPPSTEESPPPLGIRIVYNSVLVCSASARQSHAQGRVTRPLKRLGSMPLNRGPAPPPLRGGGSEARPHRAVPASNARATTRTATATATAATGNATTTGETTLHLVLGKWHPRRLLQPGLRDAST